jgi:hypothetical protein
MRELSESRRISWLAIFKERSHDCVGSRLPAIPNGELSLDFASHHRVWTKARDRCSWCCSLCTSLLVVLEDKKWLRITLPG